MRGPTIPVGGFGMVSFSSSCRCPSGGGLGSQGQLFARQRILGNTAADYGLIPEQSGSALSERQSHQTFRHQRQDQGGLGAWGWFPSIVTGRMKFGSAAVLAGHR